MKIPKYQISWKSVHWGPSCSMRTDGRTDTTELIAAFRNFAKAPNNTLHRWSYNWLPLFTFLTQIFSLFPWIPKILSNLLRVLTFSKILLIYFDQNATDYTAQYFFHLAVTTVTEAGDCGLSNVIRIEEAASSTKFYQHFFFSFPHVRGMGLIT